MRGGLETRPPPPFPQFPLAAAPSEAVWSTEKCTWSADSGSQGPVLQL